MDVLLGRTRCSVLHRRLLLTLTRTARGSVLVAAALTPGVLAPSSTFSAALLVRLGIEQTLHALAFLVPPLLELLFGLDVLQIVLGSGSFADDVLLGLLLLQDSRKGKRTTGWRAGS